MSALQELQNYTFVSKYARWLKDENRRETWKEAVDRVRNMMLDKYADKDIDDEINLAYDMVYKKKILGSQRLLQFGGPAAMKRMERSYNCSATYCDRKRCFQEMFYVLLAGCGVGYSVQTHHVNKLPRFHQYLNDKPEWPNGNITYIIEDSVQGWADSIGVLINAYIKDDWSSTKAFITDGYKIIFDYKDISPKGTYLNSSGGQAPGAEPLKTAHIKIEGVLHQCVKNKFLKKEE